MPKVSLPALATPRLTLRALTRRDAPAYLAIRSDAAVMNPTGLTMYASDDTARAERFIKRSIARAASGRSMCWGIFRATSNELLGVVYQNLTARHRRVEIGYYLARFAWGRGYMSEALGTVTSHNFDTLNLDRQQAWAVEDNVASARVLEKNGFVYEGTLRDYLRHSDGTRRNARLYGLIRPK